MPLDEQAKLALDFLNGHTPKPLEQLPVEEARRMFALMHTSFVHHPLPIVEDRQIPGPRGPISIRIYNPLGEGTHPALVYFHGGGWVLGGIHTHDPLCRELGAKAKCIVISVDYGLAPENKFPSAVFDAYAAVSWVAEFAEGIHVDRDRIAVGGDSAGGNLAAVVAIMAKERASVPLKFQLLFYPATAMTLDTPSHHENGSGYFLTTELMLWFVTNYIRGAEDLDHPYAAPLRSPDLSKLPPALIITAQYDPLRDEGEAYGRRLEKAGVPVRIHRYNGMIHGFLSMSLFVQKGREALQEAALALREAMR